MKVVLGSLVIAAMVSGCTSSSQNQQQAAGSNLTSIDVQLPAKDKLPAGLDAEKLYYCFSINNSVPTYEIGTPSCIMPMYSEAHFKSGKYESNLKLDGKLKSDQNYFITLLIGYKAGQDSGVGVVTESMEGGPYAPQSVEGAEAVTSESSSIVIDSSKTFYQGFKSISPREMAGKSSIDVVIELQGFGNEAEQLPETISTQGSDVDVKVEAVFKDPAQPTTESGPY